MLKKRVREPNLCEPNLCEPYLCEPGSRDFSENFDLRTFSQSSHISHMTLFDICRTKHVLT